MPRLIDADKLKDIISDTWILDRIDEQPTADLVKHGHWIKTLNYYENGHFYYQCSQCGYHQVAHHFADEYKYCTNCGAKMDSRERKEDADT